MKIVQRFTFFLCLLLSATHSFAQEKQRFQYVVICDDAALTERFNTGLSARLAKANVEVSDKAPIARLFLYVIKDVNSNKNTSGITVAIAHVSNAKILVLAKETIVVKKEQPSQALLALLNEQGFMHHLSAAHLDEASDREVSILLDSVVKTLLQKNAL